MGAGVVFGLIRGFAIVSISATLGATVAFLVGRYIARGWIAGKIERHPKFEAIDEAVAGEGWKIVGLLRLSPVVPVQCAELRVRNHAGAAARLRARLVDRDDAGHARLRVPGHDRGRSRGRGRRASRTPVEWAFYAVGLVATIAVTVFVTRLARRALAERVPLT